MIEELDKSIALATATYTKIVNGRAPSARLPIELMALIFEMAQEAAGPQEEAVELVLSRVSKRWRTIAIGHALLWTRIEVSSYRPTGSLTSYLQRSKRRPLSITLDISHPMEWKVENFWHGALANHIPRCRRLFISANSCPLQSIYPLLERLQWLRVPLLEDIEIQLRDYDDYSTFEHPALNKIFRFGAPKLTSIRLDGFFPHTHKPPLSGVTTLYLHKPLPESSFSFQTFQNFIAGFTSLTNLSIYGEILEDYPELFSPGSEVILPTVRALRIRADEEFHSYSSLLHMLTAPMLETLQLEDVIEDDIRWFLGSRAEGGPEKFPKLSTLIVQDSPIPLELYDALAVAFPSVKHLTCINHLEPALALLRDTVRWPDISSISLWGDTNKQVNNFLVRDALHARAEKKRPISRLCIANKPPLFPNFLLREYVHLEYMSSIPSWPAWSGIFEGVLLAFVKKACPETNYLYQIYECKPHVQPLCIYGFDLLLCCILLTLLVHAQYTELSEQPLDYSIPFLVSSGRIDSGMDANRILDVGW